MKQLATVCILLSAILFSHDIYSQTASLTGSLFTNNDEGSVRAGGDSLVITLTGDTWSATLGEDNDTTVNLIASFSGSGDWSTVQSVLDYTAVYRRSDTEVTIILPAVPAYDIFADENISLVIDETALVTSSSNLAASPDLTIQHDAITASISGSITTGISESDLRNGTYYLYINLSNDTLSASVGDDDAVTTAILDGITGDQNWATVRSSLSYLNVERTDNSTITISIGSVPDYYIGSDENVDVVLPSSAIQNGNYSVDAGSFSISNEGVSLTITGSLTNPPQKTENDIRNDQETLILTLDGDRWVPTIDNNNGVAADLLTSITGSTSWNNLMASMDAGNITSINNTRISIQLDSWPSYDISLDDYIRVEVPNSVLFSTSSGSLVQDNAFYIEALAASVSIGGSIASGADDDEASIRSGSATITLDLSEDSWYSGMGNDSYITEALVYGLSGTSAWNTDVRPLILGSDRGATYVDVSGSIVTITLPPVPGYEISANETVTITIPDTCLVYTNTGDLTPGSLIIQPAAPSAGLSSAGLIEYQLDGSIVTLSLLDVEFLDSGLDPGNFSTSYPGLIGIGNVTWLSATGAEVELTYSGDFDADINDFNITIAGSELTSSQPLTSSSISITANLEPEITGVNIIADTFKIGDVVRVDISVVDDGNDLYTLESGTVAGKTLTGLSRYSSTLYYAYFTVQAGDAEYMAADLIPVTNIRLDNSPLTGETFNGNIDNPTIIDASIPVIGTMTVTGSSKKVGDHIDVIISADGSQYLAVSPSTLNGIDFTDSRVSFQNLGSGVYLLSYLVTEGDQDVATSSLQASITLRDIAGNTSTTFTTLGANNVSVDAHSPVVNQVSVSNTIYSIGDVVEIDVQADGPGYSFYSETTVNQIPYTSSYITGTNISGNLYRLYYTVRATDQEVDPGTLEVDVIMKDGAGNQSSLYQVVEPNSLAIYTVLPTAAIIGNQEICEDDSATLFVDINGRNPLKIYVYDGSGTSLYDGIMDSPFEFKVSPSDNTVYRIDSVVDVTGIKNSGSGQVTVTVNPKTDVEIINLSTNYSLQDTLIMLEANIAGGTFSGPGVISASSSFNPSIADTTNSPHTIYYTYQNMDGCVSIDSAIVYVLGAEGDISIPANVFCNYDEDFTAIGTNTAGSTGRFSLKNSRGLPVNAIDDQKDNTAIISPTSLDPDVYTIEYTYKDGTANLTLNKSFSIDKAEEPRIIGLDVSEVCENADIISLDTDISAAVYSGSTGITGNVNDGFFFNPSLAQVGMNTIMLTNTTENNCSSSVSQDIEVFYVPDINFLEEDVCIIGDNKDTTYFTNTTPDKHIFTEWNWNFDDIFSPENISDAVEGRHSYKDPGNRTVRLTGVTSDGCSDVYSRTIQFGNKPDGGFTWTNECFVEGDSILFLNTAVAEDPIVEYVWKFFNSPVDSVLRSGAEQVYHSFPGIETYNVSLHVKTSIGCENTFNDSIQLKNTYRLMDEGEYFITFEEDNGRWSAEEKPGSQYNSWQYGEVAFPGLAPENRSFGWYLDPPDSSNIVEQSYILSPCFDLRGIEKPMVSMEIYKDLLVNEGVVLQYTIDNGNNWENLGFYNEGINWFNSFSIAGAPDGQEIGWSGTQAGNNWVKAMRYASDEIEDVPNVQFRFIYGAEHSKGLARDGFAFDNFKISSRSRLVLIEHFTNGSEVSVRLPDAHINSLYKQNFGDVVKLEFHTNFPGPDPFYDQNKYVSGTRILYYGVDDVPYTLIDGGKDGILKFDTPSTILELNPNDLILESLYEPDFGINLTTAYGADNVQIDVEVKALKEMPADERLVQVVIFEKVISGINMSNGQNAFLNVVRDMIPNAAGTAFFDAWEDGQTEELSFNWSHPDVYDPAMLRTAVFIQNDRTREIYQAATDDTTNLSTGVIPSEPTDFSVIAYPNPASDRIYLRRDGNFPGSCQVRLFDAMGRLVMLEDWRAGVNILEMNTESLEDGIYFLRLRNLEGDKTGTARISILR